MSKIKNTIIFAAIIISIILIYIFFIKKSPEEANLVTSIIPGEVSSENDDILNQNSLISKDFLSILLNVKNIKLNDQIFSDKAFTSLHDSSITLISPGNEGRPNPFAPIGVDILIPTIPSKEESETFAIPSVDQNSIPTLNEEENTLKQDTPLIIKNPTDVKPPLDTKVPSSTTNPKTQKKETKIPN